MNEHNFYTVEELAEIKGCVVSTIWKSLRNPDDAAYWRNSELVGEGKTAMWQIDIGDGNDWFPRLQGWHGHRKQGGRKMRAND